MHNTPRDIVLEKNTLHARNSTAMLEHHGPSHETKLVVGTRPKLLDMYKTARPPENRSRSKPEVKHKTCGIAEGVQRVHKDQEPRKRNCKSSGLNESIAASSALMVELIMFVFFSCRRTIRLSTESSIQRRVIVQGRVWPIR